MPAVDRGTAVTEVPPCCFLPGGGLYQDHDIEASPVAPGPFKGGCSFGGGSDLPGIPTGSQPKSVCLCRGLRLISELQTGSFVPAKGAASHNCETESRRGYSSGPHHGSDSG